MPLEGLHHVTAITGDAPRNVGAPLGVSGAGMVHAIRWRVRGPAALDFWACRPGDVGARRENLERRLTPLTNPRVAVRS
jgi:hypothetical protein